MNFKIIVGLATLLACLTGCATVGGAGEGPGMIVTFIGAKKGTSIEFESSMSASGQRFSNPGGLSPSSKPIMNGKIMAPVGKTSGAAPDGRELPEWVEFKWKELPYPGQKMPSEPQAMEAWREAVLALYASRPINTARIAVRERVPQSVIAEVIESNRKRERDKVSEKMLWVYFIWTESGVKFRWELKERCCDTVQVGGDDVGGGG